MGRGVCGYAYMHVCSANYVFLGCWMCRRFCFSIYAVVIDPPNKYIDLQTLDSVSFSLSLSFSLANSISKIISYLNFWFKLMKQEHIWHSTSSESFNFLWEFEERSCFEYFQAMFQDTNMHHSKLGHSAGMWRWILELLVWHCI